MILIFGTFTFAIFTQFHLKVEKKEHAASCRGVKELFEKEELATRQNCRLAKVRGIQSRSEMAAEERQRLVTKCAFFKDRLREVVVFNHTKEVLTRSELLKK